MTEKREIPGEREGARGRVMARDRADWTGMCCSPLLPMETEYHNSKPPGKYP